MDRVEEAADARGMSVECTVDIEAAADLVFSEWTRYEELPEIVDGVRRVHRIDAHHLLWDVDVMGRQVVWQAEIVESVESERVAWKSVGEPHHCGAVELERVAPDRTRLLVRLRFLPRNALEAIGARLGLVRYQIERDLSRFKHFIERRAAAAI